MGFVSLWKLIPALITLALLAPLAGGDYYIITEKETGWSTGIRQSTNATLGMSGVAIGDGTYSRFADMDFNDVIMKERISSKEGSMDTAEEVNLVSNIESPVVSVLRYYPGNVYTWTIEERWPVSMIARRNMDYSGRGINDRETFINNEDCTSTSFLRATDLQKERACLMELEKVDFVLNANDTTDTILADRFLPDKTTIYNINAAFNGTAELRYREARDRSTAVEGLEVYQGRFSLSRSIVMDNIGENVTNETEEGTPWLGCICSLEYAVDGSALEERAFGV